MLNHQIFFLSARRILVILRYGGPLDVDLLLQDR